MTDNDQPTSPCPPWCDQVQCQETNPADRCHQRMAVVPAVFRESDGTAAELVVATFTSATVGDEVWVGLDLGEGLSNITISVESAGRFARELTATLAGALGIVQSDALQDLSRRER